MMELEDMKILHSIKGDVEEMKLRCRLTFIKMTASMRLDRADQRAMAMEACLGHGYLDLPDADFFLAVDSLITGVAYGQKG